MSIRTVLQRTVERSVARALVKVPPAVLRPLSGPPRRSPEGYVLDAEIQSLMWLMTLREGPDMHAGDLRRARRSIDRSGSLLARPVHDVTTEERKVACAEGQRRARLYTPAALRGRVSPGLVWFHGGGFTIGSIESHDGICRSLASEAGVVVVSVDYRLAPEHPFPAAAEDAVAATRSILAAASSYGIDPRALAVGGDSAGGNLAAVASQALRDSAARPAFQLLVYPATDFTRSTPSHRHFSEGYILTRRTMDWFIESYLPSPDFIQDPRASCLFTKDLTGLPPALVVTAGFDPLRDEGKAYADRMREAGVKVEYVCSQGAVHAFFNMGVLTEPSRVLTLAADRLRKGLSS